MARLFRSAVPDAELVLHGEMITPVQVEALLAGALDIGFLRPPFDAPELDLQVVRKEPLGVVLPEGHPLSARSSVSLASLADQSFVGHPSTSVMHRTMLRACIEAGFHPRVVQEAQDTAVVVSLVAAELGVAVLPESVRHVIVTGTVFRPLHDVDVQMELAMAWRRGEDAKPLVRRFLGIARQALGLPA
jgi:DNA-binding transcriptional LysR family regulator